MPNPVTINRPEGLADFGYTAQSACIGSALTQHRHAQAYRDSLRRMLDRIETPENDTGADEPIDRAQDMAELLTELCRIGAGEKGL